MKEPPRDGGGGDGNQFGDTIAQQHRPLPPAAQEYVDRKRAERLGAEPTILLLEERLGISLDGLIAAAKRDQIRPGREEQGFALVRVGATLLEHGPLAPIDHADLEAALWLVEHGHIGAKNEVRIERLRNVLRSALDGNADDFPAALEFAKRASVRRAYLRARGGGRR